MRLSPRFTRPDPAYFVLALISLADALVTILSLGFITTDWRAAFLFRNE